MIRIADTSVPVVVLRLYHGSLGIARSLGRLGIPVYAVHQEAHPPASFSRYVRKSFAWSLDDEPGEKSVDFLLELARRLGSRPLLIPTEDVSAMLVADHAEALRVAFLFPAQPTGLAGALSSKKGMHLLCREHGIPTPETVFPESREDILRFVPGANFPVMVKGIDGSLLQQRTGVRMALAESADELLALYGRLESPDGPNLILQEYIPGGPDSVWMFNGYFDQKSDCRFGVTGRKLRQYPPYTGVTSLGICVRNDAVEQTTTAFMQALGYRGILDIGYRYDTRDGAYKLLDVNPRIGTTFRLFVGDNGLDVVRALYLDLTEQPLPAARPREGRKWLLETHDPVSSFTYFRDGRLSVGEWLRSFRGVEEAAWFTRDDPIPLAVELWRRVARAGRRRGRSREPGAPGTGGAAAAQPSNGGRSAARRSRRASR